MPTFLVERPITITRQEGDLADIVFTIPAILDTADYGIRFSVKDDKGRTVLKKDTAENDITVQYQKVTIPLLPADTKGKPGNHKWEVEIYKDNGPITIGYGPFAITPELIK
jgi:hypothetical protein